MPMPPADPATAAPAEAGLFARKVTVTCAIAFAFVIGLLLLCYAPSALILIFAAVWFGAVLHHAAKWLHEKTGLAPWATLTLVVLLLLFSLIGFGVLLGWQLGQQVSELIPKLQEANAQIYKKMAAYPQAQQLLENVPSFQDALGSLTAPGGYSVRNLLMTPFGFLVNILFIFFTGLYLANSAELYAGGFAQLFPVKRRPGIKRVLGEAGEALWHWTLARLASMVLVGILSWLGLWFLNIPMAATLGILTGLVVFIPNIGPIISLLPPMLLAFTIGPYQPLYVLALYTGIQMVESYLITPVIHQKEDNLPAAITISAQLLLGVLFGLLGITFAMPLALVAMIFVRRFYIQQGLEGRDAATTDEPAMSEAT